MSIHSTAIVDDGAEIGADVEIGAFCQIGSGAKIAQGVRVKSHVVIAGDTEIGEGTVIHPFTVLGGPPQHIGYKGEPTKLVIGRENIIREHVTMNRGTAAGRGVTSVGDRSFFMTGCHVAHDCDVGEGAIFANNATLGGHVSVGRNVFLGGLCAIHQNCRIGDYAFIGGCAAVTSDIIPYASVIGNHAYLVGLNIIGMKRRGLKRVTIHELRAAYREIFETEGAFADRLDGVEQKYENIEEVMDIINFIRSGSARSLMLPGK